VLDNLRIVPNHNLGAAIEQAVEHAMSQAKRPPLQYPEIVDSGRVKRQRYKRTR
jgi:hypothetical protein